MGKKVNPLSFRLAKNPDWRSMWFAPDKKTYKKNLLEDVKIRKFLMEKLKQKKKF